MEFLPLVKFKFLGRIGRWMLRIAYEASVRNGLENKHDLYRCPYCSGCYDNPGTDGYRL